MDERFTFQPAMYLYILNAGVALLVAFGLPLNSTVVAAITTIATAILAGVAAFMTRPVSVSALTGAAATILTAAGAFKLHLSANEIGAAVTALSIVLALLLHQNVTPVAKIQAAKARGM